MEHLTQMTMALSAAYAPTSSHHLFCVEGLDFCEDERDGAVLALAEDDTYTYVRAVHQNGAVTYYVQNTMEGAPWWSFTFAAPETNYGGFDE